MHVLTDTLLDAVFTVVGILVAAAVSYFGPKLKHWINKLADKDNLGIVQEIVDMGVELAEKELTGEEGEDKFEHAADYVANMANRYGIEVSDRFIAGAVQKGWRRMNDSQKGSDK